MRIARPSEFAMIPTWVIKHPQMRGQATRIAVYVAIRVLSFEHPNRDWASERELAPDLAEVCGVSAESCRKHLRAMRSAGVVAGDSGEIILPSDPVSGAVAPHNGATATQGGAVAPHIPFLKKEREENSCSTDVERSDPIPAEKYNASFAEFWALYPRGDGKFPASKAWTKACKIEDREFILVQLKRRIAWWKAKVTPADMIPHAGSWLNKRRWTDVFDLPEVVGERELDLAMPWLKRHGISEATARSVLGLMAAKGYGPGETLIRIAIAYRDGVFDLLSLIRVRADRFSGDPMRYDGSVDYEWAMDAAHQTMGWRVAV